MKAALCAAVSALLLAGAAPAQVHEPVAGAPDVPSGPATLRGQVVHGETGSPLAGVEVALYALTASGVPGVRRTVSDAEGRFAFEKITNEQGTSYLVGARYGGVANRGVRVAFEEGALEASVEITVSDVTGDPRSISVREARLRIDWLGTRIRVAESLGVENPSDRTYYVPAEGRLSGQPALRTRLPEGAVDLQLPLGVMPEGLQRAGDALVWWGPIPPGGAELSYSYVVPTPGEELRLSARLPAGTERVKVLLSEEGPTLRDTPLSEGEATRIEGRSYRVFEGPAPGAGAPLALALTFPPARLDPEAFQAEEAVFLLHLDDAALEVRETHRFRVDGPARVTAGDGRPLAQIPLPSGVTRLRFGASTPGLLLTGDPEGGLAIVGTAPSGESSFELSYRLPVTEQPFDFAREFALRVPLLSIYVADTGRLVPVSERLHRRRPVRSSDLTYMHLEAFEIEPGETVHLRIRALPPRRGLGRNASVAAAGLLAVVAIAFLIEPVRRVGGRAARLEAAEEESAAFRERQSLYTAIQDLDHDFETGKVSPEDHRKLRDDLRARAVELLREERLAASQAATRPASAHCPGCGAETRGQDRFCSQCGGALGTGDEREAGA